MRRRPPPPGVPAVPGPPGARPRSADEWLRHQLKREFAPTWRYGFNLAPTMVHRRASTPLGEAARRVADSLRTDGIAVTSLDELTGDPTLLARLQHHVAGLEAVQAGVTAPGKPYVVELLGASPVVDPADALGQLVLHPQVRGAADAYFGLRTRVVDLDVWRNLPSETPTRSQLWHRDLPQDRHVVKLFVYLSDVDEGAGPLTYALGTHTRAGRRLRPRGHHDGVAWRSEDADVAAVVPPSRWRTVTGPAGTVVLADTLGLHKGGWVRTSSRLVVQARYASRSSSFPHRLRLGPGADARRWAADFALA